MDTLAESEKTFKRGWFAVRLQFLTASKMLFYPKKQNAKLLDQSKEQLEEHDLNHVQMHVFPPARVSDRRGRDHLTNLKLYDERTHLRNVSLQGLEFYHHRQQSHFPKTRLLITL